MAKRKGLSKRIRFEVFKRDSFKCQYCGSTAPDALLVVDHIKPVAGGGSDDLLNLITACVGCNAGKSDIPLSDSSAVQKQRAQLAQLAERREQMTMLVEWRDGLMGLEAEKVALLVGRVNAKIGIYGHSLNDVGIARVRSWLAKFGFDASLQGIATAYETEPHPLIDQMEQFAAAARKVEREPELRDYWRIRALLRARRFRYGPEWAPIQKMRGAFRVGWSIEDIGRAASEAEDYDHFLSLIGYE